MPPPLTVLVKCLEFTYGWEGGFSDDAGDPGGKTRWGITEAVARGWGYRGPMDQLPKADACQIYFSQYFRPLLLDQIPDLPLVKRIFDFAVNCGVTTSARNLQECLNRINRQGAYWPDVVVDGHLGGGTLGAILAALAVPRHRAHLLFSMDVKRGDHFLEDIQKTGNDTNEKFMDGWLNRTAALLLESAAEVKAHGQDKVAA